MGLTDEGIIDEDLKEGEVVATKQPEATVAASPIGFGHSTPSDRKYFIYNSSLHRFLYAY